MFNYISYYNLEVQRIRLKLSISIEFFFLMYLYIIYLNVHRLLLVSTQLYISMNHNMITIIQTLL